MDQPAFFQGRLMRAAHWMNQLQRGRLPICRSFPGNTKERAVGTAENGSNHDSSEAVPTAVEEDTCFSLGIRWRFQEPAFKSQNKCHRVH